MPHNQRLLKNSNQGNAHRLSRRSEFKTAQALGFFDVSVWVDTAWSGYPRA